MKRLHIALGLALITAGSIACAQTPAQQGQQGGGEHPVRAACEGKAVGTEVSVTFRDGKTRTIACGEHHHHEQGQGQQQ